MDLLVHVVDPIDRDEVLPAARFRTVLAQYDAIGGLQVVDGTNVFAVQAHNFHILLNVQVAPPLITNKKPRKNWRAAHGLRASRPMLDLLYAACDRFGRCVGEPLT
jgi:hypothetical protein